MYGLKEAAHPALLPGLFFGRSLISLLFDYFVLKKAVNFTENSPPKIRKRFCFTSPLRDRSSFSTLSPKFFFIFFKRSVDKFIHIV